MSTSILLADDSAVARRSIRTLLTEKLGGAVTCNEADGGLDVLDKAIELQPDVVVLDIAMPGMNGVEAARFISQHCPKTAVLAISNYDIEPIVPRIRQSHIRGFVPKSRMGSQLVPAIEALLDGKTYFTGESVASS